MRTHRICGDLKSTAYFFWTRVFLISKQASASFLPWTVILTKSAPLSAILITCKDILHRFSTRKGEKRTPQTKMDLRRLNIHRQYREQPTRISGQKHTSSTVFATSLVSEVVIVWILMGWSLPSATFPTITVRVFLLLVWYIDSQYFCLGTKKRNGKTIIQMDNEPTTYCSISGASPLTWILIQFKHARTAQQSMGVISVPRSGLPSEAGSSSMVSDSALELLTTSALALEEPVLSAPGTERTLAQSTLLVKPMPPPRTLTWGSGAGATPVAMAMPEQPPKASLTQSYEHLLGNRTNAGGWGEVRWAEHRFTPVVAFIIDRKWNEDILPSLRAQEQDKDGGQCSLRTQPVNNLDTKLTIYE